MVGHHVLVVDDDPTVSDVVRRYLEQDGCRVRLARDGLAALAAVDAEVPDLIVLDLMMDGINGLEVCRRLRRTHPDLPIVMLTALGEAADRVVGLEVGADDYVTKPFSPRELVARVTSVLRRSQGVPEMTPAAELGEVRLEPGRRRVFAAGREIELTATEFDLLAYLMRRPGRVFSREQLISEVWGYSAVAGARTVDVHIAQVRAKLGQASPIRTVRGVGYAAEEPHR